MNSDHNIRRIAAAASERLNYDGVKFTVTAPTKAHLRGVGLCASMGGQCLNAAFVYGDTWDNAPDDYIKTFIDQWVSESGSLMAEELHA